MNMSIVCYLHPVSLILLNAPSLSLRCQLKHKAKECFLRLFVTARLHFRHIKVTRKWLKN